MDHQKGRRVEGRQTPSHAGGQQPHRAAPSGGQQRQRSASQKKRRGSGRQVWKTVLKVLGTLCLIGVLSIGIFSWIFMTYVRTSLAPELEIDLDDFTMNLSSIIYYQDDNGEWQELEELFGEENRVWVAYEDIPEYAWQAAVAIEDQRFFEHEGVDWRRTIHAVFNMFFGMRDTFGGSTITQQVIKNLTEEKEATVKRKVTEIFRALELEDNYSKEDIPGGLPQQDLLRPQRLRHRRRGADLLRQGGGGAEPGRVRQHHRHHQ